ncbi:hypothetical protein AAFF_G00359610 [Aldrovandia affinis]|uniref:Uncharacterized protein n=1 Tax=Aldrovandia affinis TaxID=143900 RepID=A0AAD7SIM5_9TELE|nr:hypothetical protein AAFF_G00359610 [Aldrovandia affinis]
MKLQIWNHILSNTIFVEEKMRHLSPKVHRGSAGDKLLIQYPSDSAGMRLCGAQRFSATGRATSAVQRGDLLHCVRQGRPPGRAHLTWPRSPAACRTLVTAML